MNGDKAKVAYVPSDVVEVTVTQSDNHDGVTVNFDGEEVTEAESFVFRIPAGPGGQYRLKRSMLLEIVHRDKD